MILRLTKENEIRLVAQDLLGLLIATHLVLCIVLMMNVLESSIVRRVVVVIGY
jgi:hypothetical protein